MGMIKLPEKAITKFTNNIEVPQWVIQKESNNFVNQIFEKLSKITRLGFRNNYSKS